MAKWIEKPLDQNADQGSLLGLKSLGFRILVEGDETLFLIPPEGWSVKISMGVDGRIMEHFYDSRGGHKITQSMFERDGSFSEATTLRFIEKRREAAQERFHRKSPLN